MMTTLICPTCGKLNTDSAAVCAQCGSVLKKNSDQPVSDLLAGLAHLSDNTEEDIPEWLKNLQGSIPAPAKTEPPAQPETQPEPPVATGLDENTEQSSESDQNFSGNFIFDESSDELTPLISEETTPDWLKALKTQDQPDSFTNQAEQSPTSETVDPSVYANLPDWLAALTGASQETPPASIEQEPISSSDNSSDWLANLGGDFNAEDTPAESEPAASQSANPSEWLNRMGEESASASQPFQIEPVEDAQSWLAGLTNAESIEQHAEAEEQTEPTQPSAEKKTSGGMTDWLASLSADGPMQQSPEPTGVPETPQPSAEKKTSGGMTDWLASLNADEPVQRTPEPTGAPETAQPQDEKKTTGGMTDWLTSLGMSSQSVAQPTDQQKIPESNSETPFSWMSDNKTAIETPGKLVEPPQSPFEAGSLGDLGTPETKNDMPDWLASLDQTTQENNESSRDESQIASIPLTAEPAWLSELAEKAGTVEADGEPRETQAEKPTQENSSSAVESLIPDSVEDQSIDSLLSMDSPDWLSNFAAIEPEKSALPAELPQPAGELRPEELPSWVQAMRPVESVLSGNQDNSEDQDIESQGPLAGLSSILPTQPNLMGARMPKAYSTNLVISEAQQAQAVLLENLLNSESKAQSISKRQDKSSNRPLRWLIAAVLLLTILTLSAIGSNIFPIQMPAETGPASAFIRTLSALPDSAPVLVVVDYQPGFSGELEAILTPGLEQLMSKNIRLAFISTSPLGNLMADQLMQNIKDIYSYQSGLLFVNLGYLPGGAGGIQAFAANPAAVLGQDIINGNLWQQPALVGVTINSEIKLSNFAAIIVATDSPETGRLWIEQAQPQLESKPMLMLVSAQAEPMIQPYYRSNQLAGLVSGLEGGAQYESAMGKPGKARAYWDSFGASILIAELFILIGGIWSLVSGIQSRRTAVEPDEV